MSLIETVPQAEYQRRISEWFGPGVPQEGGAGYMRGWAVLFASKSLSLERTTHNKKTKEGDPGLRKWLGVL